MSYKAFRTERVEIEPVDLCPTCPEKSNCKGVASVAIDTYFKASYFTVEPVPGDPDFFASRQYVDEQGRESERFLVQHEDLIRACEGPVRSKRGWFRKDEPECAAHLATQKAFATRLRAREQAKREQSVKTVLLTTQEIQGLRALNEKDFASLANLLPEQLDELVLFNRQNPPIN